jgi:hypothetical protein
MPDNATESSAYVFSEREIARLTIYRAAVRAGFYNEATPLSPPRVRARLEQRSNGLGTDLSSARV